MRKLFHKSNIPKPLLSKGISLVVVFAMLITAYVAFSMNKTLGWFAKNNTVTASGMITQAYDANFKIAYQSVKLVANDDGTVTVTPDGEIKDSPGEFLTAVKVPGQSISFSITITNVGVYAAEVTGVGLNKPTAADDLPIYDAEKKVYRYLSTELTTQVISASITKNGADSPAPYTINDTKEAVFLRVGDSSDAINYFDWLVLGADVSTITLEKGESITFTIQMTFEDQGDQNVYKNYREKGGTCVRDIFITYDQ